MVKRFLLLMLLFVLAACGSAEPAEETAVSETTAPPSVADNTDINTQPVAAITPATTVAEASQIREQDWAKGSSNPKVVIIEYGDFQ
ncbi:MAG: hypothetical protein Kow0080_09330 [Candidatus Promineifilaceae bacterium]